MEVRSCCYQKPGSVSRRYPLIILVDYAPQLQDIPAFASEQAFFLLSCIYFWLICWLGEVPLVRRPDLMRNVMYEISMSTNREVYSAAGFPWDHLQESVRVVD